MPISLIYLGLMLLVIFLWFSFFKRPIYEAVFISFLLLVTVAGKWASVGAYIETALETSLLYSMVAFVAMSVLLTKTKIIDGCVAIILSVVGRFKGGAGYTAVVASAFMGALSGSGPGNVMATGAVTIPTMKKSGFPAELAANIESNASYLGNMIPPSSNIVAALGAFTALYPNIDLTIGQFWIILWSISFWFILQRIFMVWSFCKYYKVEAIPADELPSLRETLKGNVGGLILPFIIIIPFVVDYLFKDNFFTLRLGEQGAKYFSSSILLFTGGFASIVVCMLVKDKTVVSVKNISKMFTKAVKSISPTIGVCLFGYLIGALFKDLDLANELGAVISGWQFGKLGSVITVCLITCFMGMVIPGSSLTVIFGSVFIVILERVGCNPLLVAAMLPCICGVMCGITPPLGLGMYAGMTLAESDFTKTFKNNLWWVAAQFVLEVVVLMGWLPVFGL